MKRLLLPFLPIAFRVLETGIRIGVRIEGRATARRVRRDLVDAVERVVCAAWLGELEKSDAAALLCAIERYALMTHASLAQRHAGNSFSASICASLRQMSSNLVMLEFATPIALGRSAMVIARAHALVDVFVGAAQSLDWDYCPSDCLHCEGHKIRLICSSERDNAEAVRSSAVRDAAERVRHGVTQ